MFSSSGSSAKSIEADKTAAKPVISPGLKLILSALGGSAASVAEASSSNASSSPSLIPLLVVSNVGAQRGSDMAEFAQVIQHLSHIVAVPATSSLPSKSDTVPSRRPLHAVCMICRSQHQHDGDTQLSAELRADLARRLGVPSESVIHGTEQARADGLDSTGTQVRRRVRSEQQQQELTGDDDDDDDEDDDENEVHFKTRIFFHYGWSFVVVAVDEPAADITSSSPSPSASSFLTSLQASLKSYKSVGFRLVTGSAAAGAVPPPGGAKITTLPADGIVSFVEHVDARRLDQLRLAATPPTILLPRSSPVLRQRDSDRSSSLQALLPAGLFVQRDFLSAEHEQKLLALCDSWPAESWEALQNRRVKCIGRSFDFKINGVLPKDAHRDLSLTETPFANDLKKAIARTIQQQQRAQDGFRFFQTKTAAEGGEEEAEEEDELDFDQLAVSEYVGAAGIPPHSDSSDNFGQLIVAVSLGAGVVFDFTRQKAGAPREARSILFPPRALLIMSGESRYDWKHAIAARQRDFVFVHPGCGSDDDDEQQLQIQSVSLERRRRISFTFRKVTQREAENNTDG